LRLIVIVMLPCNPILLALLWLVSLATLAQGAESSSQADWERVVAGARKKGGLVVSIPLVK
jgi:hypothetical protein